MQVGPEPARVMSLAAGERRLVYVPAKSVLVGVRGGAVTVEQQVWLNDGGFTIRTPLRRGETCNVTYGGHIVLQAGRPACVRLLPPSSFISLAARNVLAAVRAVRRALNACGRRLRRRAEA